MSQRIAIIGGGISGLACAFRLLELKQEKNLDIDVVLLEARSRFGGNIESEVKNGFLLEKGPDCFLTEKPEALNLCRRLGIESELVSTNAEYRTSFILKENKLIAVPSGFYLIAPTSFKTFFDTPLFTWHAKLRMMCEMLIPPSRSKFDESVGHFVRRRFGKEALERAGQPMLAGIYTADPDKLSLDATMPRFKQYEREQGSVIRGLLKIKRQATHTKASGPRYSLFMSFKSGMQTLTDALVKKIPSAWLKSDCAVSGIHFDSAKQKWVVVQEDGVGEAYDTLVLAGSARASARLVASFNPILAARFNEIQYHSVATLNFGFKRSQIKHPLDGFGFVVPRVEKKSLIACSFSSVKFSARAPQDHVLIRAFVGGAFGKEIFDQNDPDLTRLVLHDLSELLKIEGEPLFVSLSRFTNAMVEYRVGHLQWLDKLQSMCEEYPGLKFIGSSYRGVGIPQCIKEADTIAEEITR